MKNGSSKKISHIINGDEPWREKSITKPPAQRDKVVTGVKELIVSGKYGPGERLPTRDDLEASFQVSRPTIQSAFDLLGLEGFVEPRGRGGTYVTDRPPHLFQIQLVLPPYEKNYMAEHSQYFKTMSELIGDIAEEGGFNCSISYGMDPGSDMKAYDMLVDDVQQHRVAGLLFGAMPFISMDSPILSLPRVARVAVMSGTSDEYPVITVDWDHWFERCAAFLGEQDCQTVALLTTWALENNSQIADFTKALKQQGMSVPDYWVHHMPHSSAGAAANIVHMMFEPSLGQCPDALVVLDDNLYPAACEGFRRAGVSESGGPVFVAHANFPSPIPAQFGVQRLGFDLRSSLTTAVQRIRAQIEGASFPAITAEQSHFDHEL